MKKTVSIVAVLLIVATLACVLTACKNKTDEVTVSSYEIKETVVNVGDKHGTPTITAKLSDGTEKTVSKNLVYNEEDIAKLELKDDKYTKSGKYEVKVYILEEQEKYLIGTWKITVKAIKK
ncbi:MAG: hypothetical protein MR239_02710 [Clostridiales bacterium]|jgi:hypothetical protein|nr:hypothetical protein [Clostridiales bacterium]MDY4654961.1 hypothetical protein [Eubacteriales bacterium]